MGEGKSNGVVQDGKLNVGYWENTSADKSFGRNLPGGGGVAQKHSHLRQRLEGTAACDPDAAD